MEDRDSWVEDNATKKSTGRKIEQSHNHIFENSNACISKKKISRSIQITHVFALALNRKQFIQYITLTKDIKVKSSVSSREKLGDKCASCSDDLF